jgi:hypothetical protein
MATDEGEVLETAIRPRCVLIRDPSHRVRFHQLTTSLVPYDEYQLCLKTGANLVMYVNACLHQSSIFIAVNNFRLARDSSPMGGLT